MTHNPVPAHPVTRPQADTSRDGEGDWPVLVVDDSPSVRAYHQSILAAVGFDVREAGNGYEALELALAQQFALLVVDVNMPVMDGYALIAAIRTQALSPAVPIIMISTEREETDAERAYRAGANLYLIKPADPQRLVLTAQLLTGRLAGQLSSQGCDGVGGGS